MVNDDMDHLLIDRYLAGELSAATKSRFLDQTLESLQLTAADEPALQTIN